MVNFAPSNKIRNGKDAVEIEEIVEMTLAEMKEGLNLATVLP